MLLVCEQGVDAGGTKALLLKEQSVKVDLIAWREAELCGRLRSWPFGISVGKPGNVSPWAVNGWGSRVGPTGEIQVGVSSEKAAGMISHDYPSTFTH